MWRSRGFWACTRCNSSTRRGWSPICGRLGYPSRGNTFQIRLRKSWPRLLRCQIQDFRSLCHGLFQRYWVKANIACWQQVVHRSVYAIALADLSHMSFVPALPACYREVAQGDAYCAPTVSEEVTEYEQKWPQ